VVEPDLFVSVIHTFVVDALRDTCHITHMLDVRRIKSAALKRFARGDPSRVNPQWHNKVNRILAALNVAVHPMELNFPGLGFHALTGDRRGTYSVRVTGNWRLTFKWDDDGPFDVDLEDYHGK
jgi:toxin HigB-1